MRNIRQVIRSTIKASGLAILFFLLVAISLLPSSSAAASEEPKRVLLLFAEDQSFPFISILNQSIRTTLNSKAASRLEFYTEHLDGARITDKVYEKELINFWRKKYEGHKMDLVMVCIASAIDLLSRHPAELFPGVPVVFCVSFEQQISRTKTAPNVTGVWSSPPFRPTLELTLRLHPDTQRVLFVSGSGAYDRGVLEIVKGELLDFDTGGVEIDYLTDVTIGELQERLASLHKQTIVFQLSFSTDKAGVILTGTEVASKVASASTVPVYGFSGTVLGHGIAGGSLISFEDVGARAAEIGARILAGERPQDIAPQSVPTVLMFDWRQLQRWGIGEESLPPGSIVRFQMPSFWDEYRWHVISVIFLVAFQSALIAGLLINRAKRKRSNEELRESQERYGLATTAGSTGVWDWDLRTGEIYIDPLLKSILGYEDHEIRNHIDDWGRFVHPEDAQQVFEQSQAHIAGDTPYYKVEHRMLHKDGSVRWFLARGNVIRDKEGKEVRLVGTDTDITESKRADEALRQIESRNRAMLTALPDLIFMLTRDCIYLDYHARDPGELFVSPERFIGRSIHEVLPQELARSFERCIEQAAQSDEPVLLDYSLQIGSEERYYESSIVKVDGDRVMCIVRDITGRKRAEMRFRRYFELPLIGMAITSPDRRFVEVNQELCDMLGYSMDELTGKSWVDVTHPDDVADNLRLLQQTLTGETEGYTMDKRFIHRDGHTVYSSISARCVRRADRTVDHLVLVLQGITERKRAEEALLQTQSELAHVARVMTTGELAATIAHEVNQPLTAMVANANAVRRMLGNGKAGLDEAREAIDDIVKDAHRASQVVGRIRSLLRKDPRRTESLAINEVIEEVVAIVRNALVGKKVTLRMELAERLPKVEADRVEMQQVMLNLMMNGVEALSRVEDRDRSLLVQTARDESGGVLIEVRDSGVGIAPENLKHIFDAFYTTRPEGMGMGLSICRTIVEAHGGRLWAESKEDRGTTLRFTLPTPN